MAVGLVDEERQVVVDREIDPGQLEGSVVKVADRKPVGRGVVAGRAAHGPDEGAGSIGDRDRDVVPVERVELDGDPTVAADRCTRRDRLRADDRGRDRGRVRRGGLGSRRGGGGTRAGERRGTSRRSRDGGDGDGGGGDTGEEQGGRASGPWGIGEAGHSGFVTFR